MSNTQLPNSRGDITKSRFAQLHNITPLKVGNWVLLNCSVGGNGNYSRVAKPRVSYFLYRQLNSCVIKLLLYRVILHHKSVGNGNYSQVAKPRVSNFLAHQKNRGVILHHKSFTPLLDNDYYTICKIVMKITPLWVFYITPTLYNSNSRYIHFKLAVILHYDTTRVW